MLIGRDEGWRKHDEVWGCTVLKVWNHIHFFEWEDSLPTWLKWYLFSFKKSGCSGVRLVWLYRISCKHQAMRLSNGAH